MVRRKREPFHSLLAAEKGREVSSPRAHAEAPGLERGRPHSGEVGRVQAGGLPRRVMVGKWWGRWARGYHQIINHGLRDSDLFLSVPACSLFIDRGGSPDGMLWLESILQTTQEAPTKLVQGEVRKGVSLPWPHIFWSPFFFQSDFKICHCAIFWRLQGTMKNTCAVQFWT